MRVDQGERLRQARLAAGYRSGRAAALANGWSESTYRTHEVGTRTIGQDDAEKYAAGFRKHGVKVDAVDILFGGRQKPARARSVKSEDASRFGSRGEFETPQTAKVVNDSEGQCVILPDGFRFRGEEVFIQRDAATGDVVLSQRRPEWDNFFALLKAADFPDDFLGPDERDQGSQDRDPLEGVEE